MPARFVNIDRDTPLLLPPDLRQWIPENHLAHFIVDAVDSLPLTHLPVNERGTGDAQYPPRMLLSLLTYCYATGTFSSRAIEQASYTDVAVRFLSADTHPDHDTICSFRQQNKLLLGEVFVQVLALAAELRLLKVGQLTVATDGSKILANASKHAAVSYQRAGQQIELLEQEVAALLQKAEDADSTPLQDGLSIPDEIARRRERLVKLHAARVVIEARARDRAAAERPADEAQVAERAARQSRGEKPRGRAPQPPRETPAPNDQYNFTDPESRIMKAGNGAHFEQAYNAQASVETGSRLIVGARVTDAPNDKEQLAPNVAAIPTATVGAVSAVLADNGFYSEAAVQRVEQNGGPTVYAAVEKSSHHRRVSDLEARPEPVAPPPGARVSEVMAHRLQTCAGRALYKLRQQTVEPVFGIIKEALGFRRFLLRGLANVETEWTLICVAYNLRRLHRLQVVAA
ncbi:MAG: transposase [Burkholderiales bacterium]